MKQFLPITLLLGLAVSLPAQTLSFGEITLVTPGTSTTAPVYNVNLVGTGFTNQIAGFQFDLQYNLNSTNQIQSATVAVPTSGPNSNFQPNTASLAAATYNPFCVNQGSCVQPQDMGPGTRAIIIGCCSSAQIAGTTSVTSGTLTDGVVATLTVQPVFGTTSALLTLPAAYLAATSQGGTGVAAQAVSLTIGAGSSDPGATGTVNLYSVYLVGGLYPFSGNTAAPNFGSGNLQLNDLVYELLYQTGVPGFALPQACTDYFDAMDTYPADTTTTRGGDGVINLNDLVLELLRQTGVPGYNVWPVRTPRGETCTQTLTAKARPVPPEIRATLSLGPNASPAGATLDRVPVYLEGGRDLTRAGIAFSAGDEKSQLQFEAAPGLSTSLNYNSQPGFVSVAFLSGLDVRGGDKLLLGYVTGPAGSGANLRIFGTSATGLNDFQVFGVDFSGAVRQ